MIRAELRLSLGKVPYMGWTIMVLIWDGQSRPSYNSLTLILGYKRSTETIMFNRTMQRGLCKDYAQGDYVKTMHKGTM